MAITLTLILLPAAMAPPGHAAARAAAFSLGCLFIFFAIVAIQGVLINALPARLFALLSTWVQGALVAVFCLAGLHSWFIVDWRQEALDRLPDLGGWAPPIWFFGLERAMTGDRDPFFAAMAARGATGVAAAVILAALMYVLAYRRYQELLLESPDGIARRQARQWGLLRLLTRDPHQQAILEFLIKSLSRSRTHRLVLTAYVGAGLAVMGNSVLIAGTVTKWSRGWPEVFRFVAVYWPVGLSFIVLAGVRHAFLMPVELQANWLFRITESQGRREWMSAVERFVIATMVAPIQLAALPVAAAVFGWPVAARMAVLQLLVSLAAFEFLFYSWQQLPFTCSYVPGKRPLVAWVAIWLAALGGLVPLLAKIIAAMSQMWELFLIYFGVFGAVWLWARKQRREGWGEARLIYEDLPEGLPDLGIKDMTYPRAAEAETKS